MSLHTCSKLAVILESSWIGQQLKLPYLEKFLHYVVINFVFLFSLVVLQLLQISWQVFAVPGVLLNFMYFYAFHGIRLKHSVYQISDVTRYVVREEEPALTDFLEQNSQLVIVKWKTAADHSI